ncbi:MAG: PDZ domain-containing protein, partial [Planctomycetaceae bacterium]
MERRTILFLALSLAIVIGSQVVRQALFPPAEAPAEHAAEGDEEAPATAAGPAGADGGSVGTTSDPSESPETTVDAPEASGGTGDDEAVESRTLVRRSLGTLDRSSGPGLLVTLTNRGAAVERIELAGERFHDQDDRTAYVGHLHPQVDADGCRLTFVGPGSPAGVAGLREGDVVMSIAGTPTPDPEAFAGVLASHRPGRNLSFAFKRDGKDGTADVTADFRPLEVVRPERLTQPVEDGNSGACDPLSFLVSLEEVT